MNRRSHSKPGRVSHDAAAWQPWKPTRQEPWDLRRASHLIRRAGFGATFSEMEQMVSAGYAATIDSLFALQGQAEFDTAMEPMERVLSSSQDPRQLAAWWLLRMLQTPCQLLEKTTLFWHGHFATGAEKVANSRAMLNQNRLLREHALGKFEPMVQGLSKDVAMLIYLDSEDNRKTRPNENYARELMELFCLGPGNYTEQDIKELARCFTGWQINRGKFRFNKHQHDNGAVSFLGVQGKYSGEQAIRVVLDQPVAPKFIAAKMVRYFVSDEIELSDALLNPIADQLRNSDFDLGAAVRTIIGSKMFFSDAAIGRKVRSPVEMAIGLLRCLGGKTNINVLSDKLFSLGHLPMYPPNVKGWEGGRQWINAATYFGRSNLVHTIVSQKGENFAGKSVAKSIGVKKGSRPEEWIDRLLAAWVAIEVPAKTKQQLIELGSQSGVSLDRRVADVISAIGATPEYQLN